MSVTKPDAFVHRFEPAAKGEGDTLLLLHGTGGDESDLLPLGRSIAPGAALLSPRGQVLENGMPRFFRRLAEGVFDLEDLRARTHALADWLEAAAAHYGLDPARVWALGFSNGANIAASMLLLRPRALAGAILLRAMVPFEPEQAPELGGKRVLIASGRGDPLVPAAQAEHLAQLLRDAGADVQAQWSNGGHSLEPSDIAAATAWWRAP